MNGKLSWWARLAPLLILGVSSLAHGQAYKCKSPEGGVVISASPCPSNSRMESVVQPEVITEAQQQAARQAHQQRLKDLEALRARQAQEALQATKQSQADEARRAGEAIKACVDDIQRREVADALKAELIAGCQSAGASQQGRQVDRAGVQECIKAVDAQDISAAERARAVALCHGAVLPEPRGGGVVVQPLPVQPLPPQPGCKDGRCPPVKPLPTPSTPYPVQPVPAPPTPPKTPGGAVKPQPGSPAPEEPSATFKVR